MSPTSIPRLARALQDWAHATPEVRALFWYGGHGYGRLSVHSDLDAALLLRPTTDICLLAEALLAHLRAGDMPVAYHVLDPEERRLSVWLGEALTKLDVVLGRAAGELAWLADARDVPAPRLTSAWPVDAPDVMDLLQRAALPCLGTEARPRRERGEREIDKFLVAFEACVGARARLDAYAFYFQYNLALGRLTRLLQLTRVGYQSLYLPREFQHTLSRQEREDFDALAGTLRVEEARGRERALVRAFLAAVEEARRALDVRRHPAELGGFLERLQHRETASPPERS